MAKNKWLQSLLAVLMATSCLMTACGETGGDSSSSSGASNVGDSSVSASDSATDSSVTSGEEDEEPVEGGIFSIQTSDSGFDAFMNEFYLRHVRSDGEYKINGTESADLGNGT